MRAYNFAIIESNLTKLYQATWREARVMWWVQLLEGVHPTEFGKAKMSEIRRDF